LKLSAPAFAEAPALRKASGGGASRRQAQGGASGKCEYDYRVVFDSTAGSPLPPSPPLPTGRKAGHPADLPVNTSPVPTDEDRISKPISV